MPHSHQDVQRINIFDTDSTVQLDKMMTYPGPSSDEEEYGNLNATQDLRSNLVILAYAENNFPAGMKKAASRTALRLAGSDHEQCPLNVFIQPRWPFWEL